MSIAVFLGPQTPYQDLGAALSSLGISAPVAVITAGWQEAEGEIDDLRSDTRNAMTDLALYARCEDLFARAPALFERHRARQDRLMALQRLYRLRLSHALAAVRALRGIEAPADLHDASTRAAVSAVRSLDRLHARQLKRVNEEFEVGLDVHLLEVLGAARAAVAHALEGTGAVLVAGGHVAVLLGRLRLLGVPALNGERPVVAWSAGAMALTERVVLFHDHPPHGGGDPEILDTGLGYVRGVVALPHAHRRLDLDDRERVGLLARRFAPADCVTLDPGAMLGWRDGRLESAKGVGRLGPRGVVAPVTVP